MVQTAPRSQVDDATDSRPLRRILIAVATDVQIAVGVAIYAGAFMILAPMMQ
jgi:hypothetical protein